MKSITDNAVLTFREQLSRLKSLTGWSNRNIAELLGCSLKTVTNMYRNPLNVSAGYVLIIQEYLKQEERERYK